uniref:AAA family ATPase n=1 Tax=uncultured Finegoldia sp. TaxID=328009 RepID=UPI0026284593
MYISDIYLVNFQSYQDSHFTFSKNVNLITGSSDSGKTAVIRAISWVLFNDYTTDLLIRKGYKKVEVKIIFNNGYYITRGRYGSKNYYYVQTNNYEEYVNFGKEIPKEIEDIFLFKKVNIINDKYNILISSQLENSFLLSESDSSKANAIGKLVNVDILDNASRNVSKEVRALNSEMNFVKKIISEKETDLKKYDYLDYFKIKLDNLSEIYANLESDSKRLNSFEIIYNKQNELNKRISNGHKYLEKFNTCLLYTSPSPRDRYSN